MDDLDLDGCPLAGNGTEPDRTIGPKSPEDLLLELLVRWEEAHARGEELTPEVLCGGETRWLAVLRERIAKRKRLHAVLAVSAATEAGRGDGSSPMPMPVPEFPGHEVLGEVGRGGMGVVYRALDLRLGRIVALKTLAEAGHASRDQLDRFLDEAKAVARLRHPNIIAIHAIDEHEERPYFSLEYAEGGNLAQRLAHGPLSPRQAAELVESLAHAVHAAHRAGIVHRDLKPSNVLLTAEGVPKVSDFGLAKLLDGDSARTYSGQVMGTPSYMAPEQAEGRSREVGPAADVYALGAILYQSLTGRPPFLGDSALETLKLVTTTDAVPPARLRPDVPRDLETICLKCLEKAPSKRYVDALSLAEDLRRFREHRPIVARPIGVAGRLWRWAGRNRMLAAATAVVFAMFALGTPGFFVLWRGAVADRAAAVTARGRAIDALTESQAARDQAEAARRRAERSRDRAVSAIHSLLGTEWDDMLAEELRPYRKALILEGMRQAQELVRTLEGDPQAEAQRIFAYLSLAGAQLEAGEAVAARDSGRKALELAEAQAAREPSVQSREMLGATLHRLSILPDDPVMQRSYAERSNAVYETLAAEQPDKFNNYANSIALNYHNVGHVHYCGRRYSEAIAAFDAAIRVCREAIRRDERVTQFQLDLARNLVYISRADRDAGRLDAAIDAGRRGVAAYRAVLDGDPANYSCAIQLYLAHQEVGFACQVLQRWDEMIACHEASRATLKAAAQTHGGLVSRMAAIQAKLAVVDFNLSLAYATDPVRYYLPMREIITEAFTICDKLSLVQPLSGELRTVLAFASHQVADYQVEDGREPDLALYETSERLWDELDRRPPRTVMCRAGLVLVRLDLADELAARGRIEEARACRDRSLVSVRGDADLFYELALNYAVNARLIGSYPMKIDARRQRERRQKFVRRTSQMLREAIADGFRDMARLWREPELVPLRADPEFRTVTASLDALAFPADPFAMP